MPQGIEALRRAYFNNKERRLTDQQSRFADILWDAGLVTRIARPSKKELKKFVSFNAYVFESGREIKVPIVVTTSVRAAEDYKKDNEDYIKRKRVVVLAVNENYTDHNLIKLFKLQLSSLKMHKHAEVAEAVNAPV